MQLIHNRESEEYILGSMLIDNEIIEDVLCEVKIEYLFSQRSKYVFQAFIDLFSHAAPIDAIIVHDQLSRNGSNFPGSLNFLTDLMIVPTSANWREHVRIVKDLYIRRETISLCGETIQQCNDISKSTAELIDTLQSKAISVCDTAPADTFMTTTEIAGRAMERYRAVDSGLVKPGLMLGMRQLDEIFKGISGGKMIIIAGRPRMGKTALALSIAEKLGESGIPGTIFSLEMEEEEITDRQISMLSGVASYWFRQRGGLTNRWGRIVEAAEKLSSMPITIDPSGVMHISELKRRIRKAVKKGAKWIIIDQFSFIRGSGGSKLECLENISEEIAAIKKELHVPIFILAQINRDGEKMNDVSRPTLSTLKNCGKLEEDADIAMLVFRPWEYIKDDPSRQRDYPEFRENYAEIIVAKNRGGATGTAKMQWLGSVTKFVDGGNYADRRTGTYQRADEENF